MAGRPSIDLSSYKDVIISQFKDDLTASEICSYLYSKYGIRVEQKTIRRRLLEWGVRKRVRTDDTPQLRARIAVLFYQGCLPEKTILTALKNEGYSINARALARIRQDMGIRRRINPGDAEEAYCAIQDVVQKELDNGHIEGYGRSHLYDYFRNQMHIVSRDQLFSTVRKLDPAGVTHRLKDLQRHRGEYIVPGPNYIWSIDGYCKLQQWGVEIYAGLDAYSRYVMWIYVGISCRTAVSVLKQYIETLATQNIMPQVLRADRGVERPLIAAAHHNFIQKSRPTASFDGCFRYGTSTANQRIEAWWGQLTKGLLYRWQDYFNQLNEEGIYDQRSQADRIAFLAVYMPILRKEIHKYARIWNVHTIRRQPRRPNVVVGQPIDLYLWKSLTPGSGVKDYGLRPDPGLLHELDEQVADWDMNEYLPPVTKAWCEEQIKQMGHPKGHIDAAEAYADGIRAHTVAYRNLREHLHRHIDSGQLPELKESEEPTGAWEWHQPQEDENLQSTCVDEQDSGGMDIYNEGLDVMATENDFSDIP